MVKSTNSIFAVLVFKWFFNSSKAQEYWCQQFNVPKELVTCFLETYCMWSQKQQWWGCNRCFKGNSESHNFDYSILWVSSTLLLAVITLSWYPLHKFYHRCGYIGKGSVYKVLCYQELQPLLGGGLEYVPGDKMDNSIKREAPPKLLFWDC